MSTVEALAPNYPWKRDRGAYRRMGSSGWGRLGRDRFALASVDLVPTPRDGRSFLVGRTRRITRFVCCLTLLCRTRTLVRRADREATEPWRAVQGAARTA